MTNRENIPAQLKRRILVEAGHRCAIPTCRHPTTEIAHIIPYSKVKKHEYANLIALCPNCHTRFDKGEIDIESMKIYKAKLVFLNDRYSKFELNVIDYLRDHARTVIHGYLSVKNLIDDNLIIKERDLAKEEFEDGTEEDLWFSVVLTEQGHTFLKQWIDTKDNSLIY